ncbi:chymotrypsin-2-like [Topomyia yanbarensis]|uniref:chymotrypsin-2-like n=1 Tax=Topomyia yanbarensis TaxID=2498891 RepID=UPI00273B4981|nr:chymotrypsin-2-like [Topomyia yanbarensis]
MYKSSILIVGLCLAVVASASPSWRGRIAGGTDAGAGQFPYMVSLRDSQLVHFCGGAILNNRWIITAGSCAVGRVPADVTVLTGSLSLTEGGTNHQADRIVIHPQFDESTLVNDVAVMRTRTPIVLNGDTFALRMASNYLSMGYGALISGWGRQAIDSPEFPDRLQYITTTVITHTECSNRFEPPYDQRIVESVICTANVEGFGACLGDAGSPLVYNGELHGVVSWGIPCGMGHPDVHSRVTSHRPWVLVHTMV